MKKNINGPKKVVIAIQARSTSTRFPRKIFEKIDNKEILQHVIEAAESSAAYINNFSVKTKVKASIAVLVPEGDEIVKRYGHRVPIFQGSEDDVLTRFVDMQEKVDADYIVRITADCPLLPAYLISKHINIAVNNNSDYVSNVDENCRTCLDGHDVEVISARALKWLDVNAITKADREHVTLAIRHYDLPDSFVVNHVIGHIYQPEIKLSVDTKEDLERIREEYFKIKKCLESAAKIHGEWSIHRI